MTDRDPATRRRGLRVERILTAPRDLIWRAWTQPDELRLWYGPQGMTAHTCEIDLRVGGRRLIGLGAPNGFDYWTTGVYREVVAPERFVATEALADKDGNVVPATRYGMPADTPTETIVTVVLEDLGDGRTRVTLSQVGWSDESMADRAAAGWNQALDKLAGVLAAA